jgi:hypothetical protein
MTALRTKVYLGGFILAPVLAIFALLTFFSFNMWVFLTFTLLFACGVVLGPAFLGGEES